MTTTTMSRRHSQPAGQVRRRSVGRPASVNVGETERWLSVAGGAALAVFGIQRPNALGLLATLAGGALIHRGLSGHCECYQTLGMSSTNGHGPATSVPAGRGAKVEKAITIDAPADKLYRFWKDFSNLPRFMQHLKSVESKGGNRSHWVARAPLGMTLEWDAEVINDKPNELIAWRTLEGADVDSAGSVHFRPAPGGRGTEVHVVLKYDPPAGRIGSTVAFLLGQDPACQVQDDLRRFKQLMETGEIATTQGQTVCANH